MGGPPDPGTRIRVLHLLATMPVGGAENLVAAIVRRLNPARFVVRSATLGSAGLVGEELAAAGHPVRSLNLDLRRTPFFAIVSRVRRLLREERPDILHTHLYHPNLYGRLAALGLGLKGVVASVHNVYRKPKMHRRLWNFLLSRVTDRVVAVSREVMEDVRRFDGVPRSRLCLLPNGISLAALEVAETREQARERLAVSGFCLGTVGRLAEQKGQAHLLEAMQAVLREMDEATLLVAGDGPARQALEQQAQAAHLNGRVRFLGTRRDVALIYRALDVFVLPSLWEGLPLVLLEAMGAGLPVVATRVGGVPEVITQGENGLLVDPGDSRGLAQAILRLYREPALRSSLAAAGRETVARHYSQEAMLNRLEDLYLELWEKGAPS